MVVAFGDNLRGGRPLATYAIAITATAAFAATAAIPGVSQDAMTALAFVPLDFSIRPAANAYRLITAEFLHGNIMHLAGNLVFLFALGRSVEGVVGRGVFVFSFVGLGALGFLGSWLMNPASPVPIIGNSGAVSLLLGAYALLFPRARVRLLPFLRWPFLTAWAFAACWLTLQAWDAARLGEQGSGVAYWTHFAGFAIGLLAAATWREFALDTDRLIAEIAERT